MNMRLRAAVLSAVAVVTAGLLNVTGAAPASAAEGETCKDPIITGTISRVVGESARPLKPVYAEFKQEGYTDANCPTALPERPVQGQLHLRRPHGVVVPDAISSRSTP